jgi:hypothetical protein
VTWPPYSPKRSGSVSIPRVFRVAQNVLLNLHSVSRQKIECPHPGFFENSEIPQNPAEAGKLPPRKEAQRQMLRPLQQPLSPRNLTRVRTMPQPTVVASRLLTLAPSLS